MVTASAGRCCKNYCLLMSIVAQIIGEILFKLHDVLSSYAKISYSERSGFFLTQTAESLLLLYSSACSLYVLTV